MGVSSPGGAACVGARLGRAQPNLLLLSQRPRCRCYSARGRSLYPPPSCGRSIPRPIQVPNSASRGSNLSSSLPNTRLVPSLASPILTSPVTMAPLRSSESAISAPSASRVPRSKRPAAESWPEIRVFQIRIPGHRNPWGTFFGSFMRASRRLAWLAISQCSRTSPDLGSSYGPVRHAAIVSGSLKYQPGSARHQSRIPQRRF